MRVLAGSPLTRELSPDDRRDVNGHLTAWSWAEGDPLVLAGDELSGSYLVVSGRVRVTRDTVDGREITVDIAAPGDTVGPLRTEPAVTESAWAMETTCALFLPADSLAEVVGDHPRLALALMWMQQERLTQARDSEIARHSVGGQAGRLGAAVPRPEIRQSPAGRLEPAPGPAPARRHRRARRLHRGVRFASDGGSDLTSTSFSVTLR